MKTLPKQKEVLGLWRKAWKGRSVAGCTASFFLLCSVFLPFGVHAAVLGGKIEQQKGDGVFVKLDATTGFQVGADNFDTCHLYAFDEDQDIALENDIHVEIGGENGIIPAGRLVSSHYVFFDSIDGVQIGYVDFDAPVVGIATQRQTLQATDPLANTIVQYLSIDLRGLETGDHVWIDGEDPHRIWVYWAGSSPGDYIRVFTSRAPGV